MEFGGTFETEWQERGEQAEIRFRLSHRDEDKLTDAAHETRNWPAPQLDRTTEDELLAGFAIDGVKAKSGRTDLAFAVQPEPKLQPDLVPTDGKGGDDLDHSRQLDVHVWSKHPEVNAFVDQVYEEHFKGGNTEIRKKHLKVVLLDLYLSWCNDPRLKVAYRRNVNEYDAGSRYNELHISKLTIDVVDRLVSIGLLHHVKGFNDRESGIGRVSRMWPTDKLIAMFQDARFGPLDIGESADRECIVLKNDHDEKIEYEDTDETKRMRSVLREYNDLLRRTFIDIPTLEQSFINLEPSKKGKPTLLRVNQHDKFVRRIFNRGSFEKNGRFWGGWWQRCPKEWRGKIFLNDRPTSELDYSGLHPVLLYAKEGIDYWREVNADPYAIPTPDFLESAERTRAVAKQLLLIALNAKDDRSAFGAFREDAEAGSMEKRLTNKQLGYILDQLRDKHKPIAHRIASDAGIDLMYVDSTICEKVIQFFTGRRIPILSLHDSFIVPSGWEQELETQMMKAFAEVAKKEHVKITGVRYSPKIALRPGGKLKRRDFAGGSLCGSQR